MLITPTATMLLCMGLLILFAANLSFAKPDWFLIETKDSNGVKQSLKKYPGGSNQQHLGSGSDYADYDILGDILGGLGGGNGTGGGFVGDLIKNVLGTKNKTFKDSWNSLKTEIRSYDFEPIITKLHKQSMNGDLDKVLDAIDKDKILDAFDIEGLGKEIADFAQKQLDEKRMRVIIEEAHKVVQGFDEYNITAGIYPEKLLEAVNLKQFWTGFNFGKILSGMKMICKGIDLRVSLKGVKMKNVAKALNPKEFSNKLGEKIAKKMEKIEGTLDLIDKAGYNEKDSDKEEPTGGLVKDSKKWIFKFKKYVDTKKIIDAVDIPKLIDGLQLKIVDLLVGIDIGKTMKMASDLFNIYTQMSEDVPNSDEGPNTGDEGSTKAPEPPADEGTTAGNEEYSITTINN